MRQVRQQERGDKEEATRKRQQGRGHKEEATKKRRQKRGDKEEAIKKRRQGRGDKKEATRKRRQGGIRGSVVLEPEAGRRPEICFPGVKSVGEPVVAV